MNAACDCPTANHTPLTCTAIIGEKRIAEVVAPHARRETTFVDDTGDADQPIAGLSVVEEPGFTLANLTEIVYRMNIEKGWIGDDRTVGDDCALMHSEVSEILEEHRMGREPNEVYYEVDEHGGLLPKPMGVAIEVADYFIRGVDFVKRRNIDLQSALEIKLAYNATRPLRHGGKRL